MINIKRLIWESWNIQHIDRHRVTPEEVEEVCRGKPITSQTYGGRIRVVGPTQRNRMITVILAPTSTKRTYYPVTARPSDRKERRIYEQQRKSL